MAISVDKHSASKTIKQLYSGVSAIAQFSQTGNHSLGLTVTITFNDDSYLQKSYSIFINVVDATLTIYAKAPDKIVFLSGRWGRIIPHCVLNGGANHDIVGHSFWKCETDVTTLSVSEKSLSGEKYGFYPTGGFDTGIKSLASKQGEIRNDNGHSITASKSYSIEFNSAKDVFQETINLLKEKSLKYNLVNQGVGKNCTGQCVEINGLAGCDVLDGKGRIGFVENETDTTGTYAPFRFANPYHHSLQIQTSP